MNITILVPTHATQLTCRVHRASPLNSTPQALDSMRFITHLDANYLSVCCRVCSNHSHRHRLNRPRLAFTRCGQHTVQQCLSTERTRSGHRREIFSHTHFASNGLHNVAEVRSPSKTEQERNSYVGDLPSHKLIEEESSSSSKSNTSRIPSISFKLSSDFGKIFYFPRPRLAKTAAATQLMSPRIGSPARCSDRRKPYV